MLAVGTLLGEDLWRAIRPLLPPEQPKPKGGRLGKAMTEDGRAKLNLGVHHYCVVVPDLRQHPG